MKRPTPKLIQAGVYVMFHKPTGSIYIGQTKDLHVRKRSIRAELKAGNPTCRGTFRAICDDWVEEDWLWAMLETMPLTRSANRDRANREAREEEIVWRLWDSPLRDRMINSIAAMRRAA